jgi:hypothetical protein
VTAQHPRSHHTRPSIPRTPITAYAYCGDCGADAGSPCVDEDLRPCSLCPGRVLASTQADKRDAYQRSSAKPATPRASRAKDPPADRLARYTATCAHCGVGGLRNHATYCQAKACQLARLQKYRRAKIQPRACRACGCEVDPMRWWCATPACQAVRRRVKRERNAKARPTYNYAPRASRAKGPPCACVCCGGVVQRGGRYCSLPACKSAKQIAARRMKVLPCWWCGVDLPTSKVTGGGHRHRLCERPCCGDQTCRRAIKRDRMERERATQTTTAPTGA